MQAAQTATLLLFFATVFFTGNLSSQESQTVTQLKVKQLIEKKAEYHRLTNGERDGYRIKIYFGDRDQATMIREKFNLEFPDHPAHEEYQQPYWVVLVGDFKTKLEAYASWKKIQPLFPNAFIVNDRIKTL